MKLTFDHIHCVHTDVDEAVAFYMNVFGATETNRIDRGGAPQVYLDVHGASIIIRGKRDGEELAAGAGRLAALQHRSLCVLRGGQTRRCGSRGPRPWRKRRGRRRGG